MVLLKGAIGLYLQNVEECSTNPNTCGVLLLSSSLSNDMCHSKQGARKGNAPPRHEPVSDAHTSSGRGVPLAGALALCQMMIDRLVANKIRSHYVIKNPYFKNAFIYCLSTACPFFYGLRQYDICWDSYFRDSYTKYKSFAKGATNAQTVCRTRCR